MAHRREERNAFLLLYSKLSLIATIQIVVHCRRIQQQQQITRCKILCRRTWNFNDVYHLWCLRIRNNASIISRKKYIPGLGRWFRQPCTWWAVPRWQSCRDPSSERGTGSLECCCRRFHLWIRRLCSLNSPLLHFQSYCWSNGQLLYDGGRRRRNL